MKLDTQKRISASILKCSIKRVKFDPERLEEIKESMTKQDLKSLITNKAITIKPIKGTSKVRARKIKIQKGKGRRKGMGSRKGKKTARYPKKLKWMNKIRVQRKFIKKLKENKVITQKLYRDLRSKSKGGFFRSKRHIKIYLNKQKTKNE